MTRSLWIGAVSLLILKVLLTALFPVMGDEAYYIYWGLHPAGGYYDLPPMIGWWLIPFVQISLNPLWLRLPSLVGALFIAFGLYEWLRDSIGKKRALLVSLFFFSLPLPFFAVFLFPDVPLLYFGFYASLLFYRAIRSEKGLTSALESLLAGALLGAAFLSKYFAVFFVVAFGLWFLTQKKKAWSKLLWFSLGFAPFLFQHLFWNRQNCWANFVFNLVTRQKANDGSLLHVMSYFVLYLGIASTPFLWKAFRSSLKIEITEEKSLDRAALAQDQERFFLLLWLVPVLIFGLTTLLGKGQGLHWLLFLTPYFVAWAGLRLTEVDLEQRLKLNFKVVGLLALCATFALAFPERTIGNYFSKRFPLEYLMLSRSPQVIKTMEPLFSHSAMVFTESYSLSSLMDYEFRRASEMGKHYFPEVSVWGRGSRFGRAFDWNTDFKILEGRNLVILTPGRIDDHYWSQFFNRVKNEPVNINGTHFWVLSGEGFHSELYLEKEFRLAVKDYYPYFAPGECRFRE